ncbi:hypothetical protein STSP1_00614 [Sedimentisphaera salicampi]|uniref:Uncharacterized protein n=1 Tax=Sedimentisphaera salicampi TaxID=1941349 RepID=A0A1W6LKB6_9BACT|nr:hypothetical protein STSP1_00614 [Sedimentisphaera salicampi]
MIICRKDFTLPKTSSSGKQNTFKGIYTVDIEKTKIINLIFSRYYESCWILRL